MAAPAHDAGAPSPSARTIGSTGYDRVPPHNLDAEVSVLGSMLLSRNAVADINDIVGPEDFYRGAHRTIFEASRDLYNRGEPLDTVTVADELDRRGSLDDVGGIVALTGIVQKVPTAANALYYARIVAEQALRRRLIDAGTEITRLGYQPEQGVAESVDAAEQVIFDVAQRGRASDIQPIKPLLHESFELLERLSENNTGITGLPTGFIDFDDLTAGLQPGNLVIVAARPAMGKSTLVTNMASHVTVETRVPVAMFSLEMSSSELVMRLLSAESRVSLEKLRTGRLDDPDWAKLSQAMGRLAEAPLYIDDTPGINLMEIRSKCRRIKQKHGLSLVIIDYLQLMQSHRRVENRVQEVSELSRGLKILAKELDLPVIALSQLSRKPEDRARDDRRPQLADLRESGCLTADARVLRADTGGEVTMGELCASGERDIPVWSVGPDYRIVRATMTHVFPTGIKETFALRLASGREVKASANHPFLTIEGWKRLDELAVGSRIAVPRSIPEPATTQVWDDAEVIMLAHLLGDGCVAPRQPIHYTSADIENIEAVEQAAAFFGITPRRVRQKNCWHTYLPAPYKPARGRRNPIAAWLDQFGLYGKRSGEKFIPAEVFSLKDPQVALFLRHLWSTDGHLACYGSQVSLYYASNSPRMLRDLQQLLLRFGVHAGIHRVTPRHEQLWIRDRSAQIRFLTDVGVYGRRGEHAQHLCARLEGMSRRPSGDTIPHAVWLEVERALAAAKQTVAAVQRDAGLRSLDRGSSFSRQRLNAVATSLGDRHLQRLATSDLYWDRIIAIDPLGPETVYDATVKDTHNFIANNIILENSIEQDADLVAFIYRDEVYDPESPAKGEAELIVAKHRNGPLRTIRLSFLGHHSRFANMARGPVSGGGPL